MSVLPGPNKNESQQKFKFFKSRKESMTVHADLEAKRLKYEQVLTLPESLGAHVSFN